MKDSSTNGTNCLVAASRDLVGEAKQAPSGTEGESPGGEPWRRRDFLKVGLLSQFHEVLNRRVHRAKDIGDFRFSISLVVNEPGWIVCTNPGGHRLVIAAKK